MARQNQQAWENQVDNKLYPTVYCLWAMPKITCNVRTMDVVIKKLAGGAGIS